MKFVKERKKTKTDKYLMRLLLPSAGNFCLASPLLEVGFLLRHSLPERQFSMRALKMAGYWIFV